MLALLLVFGTSAIFGIDFGSRFTKVAMALMGRGVHVALNQQSKRLSPSTFAIFNLTNPKNTTFPIHWDKEQLKECNWLFCDQAEAHGRRFPKNIVKGLGDLFGYEVGLTRKEILALMLKHLISTADENKWRVRDANIVFAVEPWMKRSERYAIKESVEISEAKLISIIESPTAAATNYALEKQKLYQDAPKTVAFIDLGSAHTWAALYNFSNGDECQVAEELSVVANTDLGGDYIDRRLAEHLEGEFAKRNNLSPPFEPRVSAAFLAEASRVKERLTVSDRAAVHMEDVVGDFGLEAVVTRDDFVGLVQGLAPKVSELLDRMVSEANVSKAAVESIELLGGLSRVPFLMDAIKEWSGMEKLNRTMNSDEAVAIGAGYEGASHSSSFIIRKVASNPRTGVRVFVTIDGNRSLLFDENSRLRDERELRYEPENLPQSFEIDIEGDRKFFRYSINMPIIEEENLTINDNVTENTENNNETESINNVIDVENNETEIVIDEENITEVKEIDRNITVIFGFDEFTIPVLKYAKMGEMKLEVETYKADWMETANSTEQSISFLNHLEHILYKRRRVQELRSDHEAKIYKIRERLESDTEFIESTNESERKMILAETEAQLEWATNSSKKSSRTLREHIMALEESIEAPERRIRERKERPEWIDRLKRTIAQANRSLESLPEKKPWVGGEALANLSAKVKESQLFLEEAECKIILEAKDEDAKVTADEIRREWDALDLLLDRIESTPEPVNETATNGTEVNSTETVNINLNETENENENAKIDRDVESDREKEEGNKEEGNKEEGNKEEKIEEEEKIGNDNEPRDNTEEYEEREDL